MMHERLLVKNDALEDEVERLRRENLALRDTLRALTAVEPFGANQAGEPECVYCSAFSGSAERVHDPDCPWLTAKALLPEAP